MKGTNLIHFQSRHLSVAGPIFIRSTSASPSFSGSCPWSKRRKHSLEDSASHAIASGDGDALLAGHHTPPEADAIPRQRGGSPAAPLIDLSYVRRNFPLPSRAEYPNAPKSLFMEPEVKTVFGSAFRQMGIALHTDHSVEGPNHKPIFTFTVTAEINGRSEETAIGQARQKRAATSAAYLHLLSKLHQSGILKTIFSETAKEPQDPPDRAKGEALSQETIQKENDAKVDVYNYAARYGLVPDVTVRPVMFGNKDAFEVAIDLEEQNIHVTGAARNLHVAEIVSSVKFKEAAEEFHKDPKEDSVSNMDINVLSTENVMEFVDFYRWKYRGYSFEVEPKHMKDSLGVLTYEAQARLKGLPIGKIVTSIRKKTARRLAFLAAAVEICKMEPGIADEFRHALENSRGGVLFPVKPIRLRLSPKMVSQMDDTLHHVAELGRPSDDRVKSNEETATESGRFMNHRKFKLSPSKMNARSLILKQKLVDFRNDPKLKDMRNTIGSLPISKWREEILELVTRSPFSIILGATGSGKTKQVPQILLDDAISNDAGATCNIICTQPRKIAATSMARRVAIERNESLQDTVGYQVKFDAKRPNNTGSITYCTTGTLLQQLKAAPDEVLDTISHIIVDEVHERDILIDFLLLVIKQTIHGRLAAGKAAPKVVLMSATIDPTLFAKYFEFETADGTVLPCPSLSIPGRTFPVEEKYLDTIIKELEANHGDKIHRIFEAEKDTPEYLRVEANFKPATVSEEMIQHEESESVIDWKRRRIISREDSLVEEEENSLVPVALVAATIAHIAKTTDEGAILAFLPGFQEIKRVKEILEDLSPLGLNFSNLSAFRVSILHSTVPAADQAAVFDPVPTGCRKIILSTNIAETSVTIPDIKHVIDTGKFREKRFDHIRRITKLECTWISKSSARQRAGRAGRVRNGSYYALYSKDRSESLGVVGTPEMLRSDLQEVCLQVKAQALQIPARDFLAAAIEPPPPAAVDASIEQLEALGALTHDEKMTNLGRLLSNLPVHPSLGKMIVLGVIFRCLDPMIVLGAALNERSLFTSPLEKRKEANEAHHRFTSNTGSDHLALINAVRTLRLLKAKYGLQEAKRFCFDNFLNFGAFQTIESTGDQIEEVLVDAGLIPFVAREDRFQCEIGHPSLNKTATAVPMIKSLMLSGLHPNLAVSRGAILDTRTEKHVTIHPGSLNYYRHRRNSSANTTDDENQSSPTGTLFTYSTMQKASDGSQTLLRDTTMSTPLMAALFGGSLKWVDKGKMTILDDWLPMTSKAGSNSLFAFRQMMDDLLADAFRSLAELKPRARKYGATDAFEMVLSNVPRLEEAKYFADDEARDAFTRGLLKLFDEDSKNNQKPIEHSVRLVEQA